jgi:hypothetical protein
MFSKKKMTVILLENIPMILVDLKCCTIRKRVSPTVTNCASTAKTTSQERIHGSEDGFVFPFSRSNIVSISMPEVA